MSIAAIPTDSVLKRHYDAMHGKRTGGKSPSKSQGGFFSWVKKIFSG